MSVRIDSTTSRLLEFYHQFFHTLFRLLWPKIRVEDCLKRPWPRKRSFHLNFIYLRSQERLGGVACFVWPNPSNHHNLTTSKNLSFLDLLLCKYSLTPFVLWVKEGYGQNKPFEMTKTKQKLLRKFSSSKTKQNKLLRKFSSPPPRFRTLLVTTMLRTKRLDIYNVESSMSWLIYRIFVSNLNLKKFRLLRLNAYGVESVPQASLGVNFTREIKNDTFTQGLRRFALLYRDLESFWPVRALSGRLNGLGLVGRGWVVLGERGVGQIPLGHSGILRPFGKGSGDLGGRKTFRARSEL